MNAMLCCQLLSVIASQLTKLSLYFLVGWSCFCGFLNENSRIKGNWSAFSFLPAKVPSPRLNQQFTTQSRQSVRLFLQSFELGPTTPLRRVCPPLVPGETHSLFFLSFESAVDENVLLYIKHVPRMARERVFFLFV